jgi:hypothetical protein
MRGFVAGNVVLYSLPIPTIRQITPTRSFSIFQIADRSDTPFGNRKEFVANNSVGVQSRVLDTVGHEHASISKNLGFHDLQVDLPIHGWYRRDSEPSKTG